MIKIRYKDLIHRDTDRWGRLIKRWGVNDFYYVELREWMDIKDFQEFDANDPDIIQFYNAVMSLSEKSKDTPMSDIIKNMKMTDCNIPPNKLWRIQNIFRINGGEGLWQRNFVDTNLEWCRNLVFMGSNDWRPVKIYDEFLLVFSKIAVKILNKLFLLKYKIFGEDL